MNQIAVHDKNKKSIDVRLKKNTDDNFAFIIIKYHTNTLVLVTVKIMSFNTILIQFAYSIQFNSIQLLSCKAKQNTVNNYKCIQ